MRRWIALWRRKPPPGINTKTWELAQTNALERYAGPTVDEPYVHLQLQDLRGALAAMFRNDVQLQLAQAGVGAVEIAAVAVTERREEIIAETAAAIHDAEGAGTGGDLQARVRRAAGSRARSERRTAGQQVQTARLQIPVAQADLRTAETAAIGRLVAAATTGLLSINQYLGALNVARRYDLLPPVDALNDDMVDELVRRAVRPIALGLDD